PTTNTPKTPKTSQTIGVSKTHTKQYFKAKNPTNQPRKMSSRQILGLRNHIIFTFVCRSVPQLPGTTIVHHATDRTLVVCLANY
ncbi:hypothetical protein, partial [Bifidobacterium jacchi]|uniref:hypothetical protein n=1 Tax=Bifidobacterium jacchi TaxID=2490545 RepID=UPI0019D5341D